MARSHARQTTKGGHRDTIPIARPLRPFLEHALEAASDGELVFPAPDGERRREDLDAVAIVRTALKRAGLVEAYEHVCRRCKGRGEKDHTIRAEDGEQRKCARCGMRMWPKAIPRHVTFHGLRHTTATLLFRAGVDPHRVQRILRHRDVQTTTKTYAHLLTEDLRGAVNLLPAAAPPEAGAIASGATGGARFVPILPLRAQSVKWSGPTPGEEAKEVGPLGWRAIQDSNLWPSAPEAFSGDMQPDGVRCRPLESLEQNPRARRDAMQSDATICRILVPSVSPGLLTVRDVALALKVSTATVYKLVSRGKLPHARVSNAIRISPDALRAFLSGTEWPAS